MLLAARRDVLAQHRFQSDRLLAVVLNHQQHGKNAVLVGVEFAEGRIWLRL